MVRGRVGVRVGFGVGVRVRLRVMVRVRVRVIAQVTSNLRKRITRQSSCCADGGCSRRGAHV